MESKEFSLEQLEMPIKEAFYEECYIMPKNVYVSVLKGDEVRLDHDLIIAKVCSGYVIFPSVVSKLAEMGLCTIGFSRDKNFYEFIFDHK